MRSAVVISEADLRQAWRQAALKNSSFEQSMNHPALSIALRRMAENNVRRQLRLADLQRNDRKRAQANDHYDND